MLANDCPAEGTPASVAQAIGPEAPTFTLSGNPSQGPAVEPLCEDISAMPYGTPALKHLHQGEVDPPLTLYGCKRMHIDRLLAVIPPHRSYIEPFCGTGALFFAKPYPKGNSFLNDLSGEIFNLLRVMRDQGEELAKRWSGTTYCEDIYRYAEFIHSTPHIFDDLTRAWATLVGMRFMAAPLTWGKTISIEYHVDSEGRKTSHAHRLYRARHVITPEVTEKLRRTTLCRMDAVECLQRYNFADAFYFVDPPYAVQGRKTHMGHYENVFTPDDLMRLLDQLAVQQGKWLLTCYETAGLFDRCRAHGWQVFKVTRKARHQKSQHCVLEELFVANYDISALADHGGEPVPLS